MIALYPLVFQPILLPKVWGGRALERLGKRLPDGPMIGESWEIADLSSTSASGAGGGAQRSIVRDGPLAGSSLSELVRSRPEEILGAGAPAAPFPLLVKYLDARENLSVQVHPSAAYARAHPGSHLKTECWFILDALPGSFIYAGVKPGVTRDSFAKRLDDGVGRAVVDDLIAIRVRPGEMYNLPSGTVHALGAGVVVAEVQTPSDTTFRVYDWGRQGRELHVREAIECIEFGPAPAATRLRDDAGVCELVRTEYFTVRGARARAGDVVPLERGVCSIVMTIGGRAVIASDRGAFAPVPATADATLVPAATAAAIRVESDATVLIATPSRRPGTSA